MNFFTNSWTQDSTDENFLKIFNNIVELLRKAEEWVESAEFGKRENY